MARIPSIVAIAVIATVRFAGPKTISRTMASFSMTGSRQDWKASTGDVRAIHGQSANHKKQRSPMPDKEDGEAVGSFGSEHQLQNRQREETRGKTPGCRRNPRND